MMSNERILKSSREPGERRKEYLRTMQQQELNRFTGTTDVRRFIFGPDEIMYGDWRGNK